MGDVAIEGAEVDAWDDKVPRLAPFVLIGANDMDLVALALHVAHLIHGGNGRAVIFFPQDFADECNDHNKKCLTR